MSDNPVELTPADWQLMQASAQIHTLQQLMQLIDHSYRFDAQTYPALQCDQGECEYGALVVNFAVAHSALHMIKSTAVVAAEAERVDHGGTLDRETLKVAIRKQLVNTLKLAAVLELSAADLIEMVVQAHADNYAVNK